MSKPGIALVTTAAAVSLAVAPVSSSLTAQEVGDRVRVLMVGATAVGEVTAVTDEGFELGGRGRGRFFSYAQIYGLQRSTGVRRYWKTGLAYGAGAGVATGLVMGLLAGAGCAVLEFSLGFFYGGCPDGAGLKLGLVTAATLGVWGGGLGAAVGALIRRESWTVIPMRGRRLVLSPLLAPVGGGRRGGLVVGARFGF